jgi:trimeric autotransporter adhesin
MINTFTTLLFGLLLVSASSSAQNVGIGIASPNGSAQLDVSSSSRGLLIPRMTTTGIEAITSPARGLLVYDSTLHQLMVNNGTAAAPDWQSTIVGSGWSLTGNSGTNPYSQFIGSTDNTAINFRVGNVPAGTLDPNGSVFWGLNAGASNTPDGRNVGLGTDALKANTTGQLNVGIGGESLVYNVSGTTNVGVGEYSLYANATGNDNVAIGNYASGQNQGSSNVAVGEEALTANVYDDNVAVGYWALRFTTQAGFNTAIGYGAGSNYDNGYNNVFIGANTGTTGDGFYNCIAIGQDVYCTDNSQVRIGNAATTSIGGYVGWSTFSDGRIKKDISENVKGLDFILKLRPVTYRLDMAAIERRRPKQGPGKTVASHKDPNENEGKVFSGFIAQEVEKAAQESGYDFAGVDKPKNENDLYTLRYADFVAPLVKAVQEMNARVDRMEKENEQLKQQIKNR